MGILVIDIRVHSIWPVANDGLRLAIHWFSGQIKNKINRQFQRLLLLSIGRPWWFGSFSPTWILFSQLNGKNPWSRRLALSEWKKQKQLFSTIYMVIEVVLELNSVVKIFWHILKISRARLYSIAAFLTFWWIDGIWASLGWREWRD